MMEKHGIYVQDINYPTVARGEEKLRIAPTPHHTDDMKRMFVKALVDVWEELDLPLTKKPVPQPACFKFTMDHHVGVPIAVQA